MKSFLKIKGFVISFTAMSILLGVSMNSNIKNVQAGSLESKNNTIFNQEHEKMPYGSDYKKNFINGSFINNRDKFIFDKNNLDISLNYETKDYLDNYGRVIGSYPVISNIQNLSNQILVDINSKVDGFNLNINDEIYEPIVKFSTEQKNGYAKISITINNPNDNSSDHLEYYLDLLGQKQVSSDIYLTAEENNNTKSNLDDYFNQEFDITMVPLRVNAEKLGWKVGFEPKKGQESSKVTLKKDNKKIEILVDSNLEYDLIINDDSTKEFIRTEKLDRKAELQDNVVYVPSSFLKYIMSDSKLDNNKTPKKDMKSGFDSSSKHGGINRKSEYESGVNNKNMSDSDLKNQHENKDESKKNDENKPFRRRRFNESSIINITPESNLNAGQDSDKK